jgi:subtilisin family serine protease
MATRTWLGGTGLWTNEAAWSGDTVPSLADSEIVASGTAEFAAGETLEAATIGLGSFSTAAPAALVLTGSLLGYQTTIDSTTAGEQALLVALGAGAFNGTIDAGASGGSFNIAAYASGGSAGNFTLLDGSQIDDSNGDSMLLIGTLTNHATIEVGTGGNFVNDGTVTQAAGAFEVQSGGTLSGAGLFQIGLYSSLNFQAGSAASAETVRFTDVGGRLLLADPANFTGVIGNFATGDVIDLTSTIATAATYDAASGLLSVTDNGAVVATLTLNAPAGTGFQTLSDGSTGTIVRLDGAQDRIHYLIEAADRAMGGNVVRADLTTHGGAAITGAGVRIGIISDSFDAQPGVGAADVANAAAQAGFLPENADGTSAVTVLTDAYGSGDDNEGLAMAELVHQSAPGASIDFATGDNGLASFAAAVTSLQQAGCNVIVDDLGYDTEPFFQDAGPLDTAIDNAVASGVTYVTAAGNNGGPAYQAVFAGTTERLYDGTTAPAQIFSNGTPYQAVTLLAGITASFDLQWATPYGAAGSGALQAKLFDSTGNVVAASATYANLGEGQSSGAGAELSFTPPTTGTYQLAITGTLTAGTIFKYILLGTSGGGTDVAGTIDDPAADAGTIKGHAMLPSVLTVGAQDFAETPLFGTDSGYATYYSSTGDAEFLYDADGDAIADPAEATKPDILAPVEAGTSVTGFAPFAGTSAAAPEAAAVAALMLQANPSLTPAEIKADLEQSADSIGQPGSIQGAGAINAEGAVDLALGYAIACFAQGTSIATARGPVAVEDLCIGDAVLTESGQARPVVWLGHRRVACARHPHPQDVWPVRVQAHAFAPNRPSRDLFLSPDHAVKFGGMLMPVRYLVNGASIAQIPTPSVVYWHVELPAHDILLADNLPAESFLDTGNRAAFANGGPVVRAHPDFSRLVWEAEGCAPLAVAGPAVAGAHAHLLARAQTLGHRLDPDPALRVLPSANGTIRLLSRTWVPAHHGDPDHRRLGIAIANLRCDGVPMALDDATLTQGWHEPEGDWRWTDGAAVLATNGAKNIAFDVALPGRYWVPAYASVNPASANALRAMEVQSRSDLPCAMDVVNRSRRTEANGIGTCLSWPAASANPMSLAPSDNLKPGGENARSRMKRP